MAKQILEETTNLMTHRGPDDFGIYLNAPDALRSAPYNIDLGRTRLSIIDLSTAGHQPMCNLAFKAKMGTNSLVL